VELGVRNSSAGPGDDGGDGAEGTGLGTQLIDAFVRQLNGTIERHHQNGSYGLAVRFPLRTLAEGEERRGREAGEEAAE
jgi:two-component sensor histidine kinase